MPRTARAEICPPDQVNILHITQRCVRRAFLTGEDPVSGCDYGHRRRWIQDRLEFLASCFAIDVLAFSTLSNHAHWIVRNRPDLVSQWPDREVAVRWLQLFPGQSQGQWLGVPTEIQVQQLLEDPERLQKIRTRLSDVSWFMRALCEPIARRANREDNCTGSFWEGRFKAQQIVDEAGLLACAMYVDLNQVRAGLAKSPEVSSFSSLYERILGEQGQKTCSQARRVRPLTMEEVAQEFQRGKASNRRARMKAKFPPVTLEMPRGAWLAPLTITSAPVADRLPSASGLRASDQGFLEMSLESYRELLTWTWKQGNREKAETIPDQLAPILERVGLCSERFGDLVRNFRRYFRGDRVGLSRSLRQSASRNGRRWHHGQRAVEVCCLEATSSC